MTNKTRILSLLAIRMLGSAALASQNTQVQELPEGFRIITENYAGGEYQYLRVSGVTTLPVGIFDKFPNLQWLYLDNNDLTTLPAGYSATISSCLY